MSPCFFDLSARTNLRVTGADRGRFMNGQTTNDVRKSSDSATQESCVLNTKGHLEAHLFLFTTPEAIWIDAAAELRESLKARLERYVIADDVAIEDVTDDFALFHVITEKRPQIPEIKFCLSSRRLFQSGWDVWDERSKNEKIRQALAGESEFISPDAVEILRIENGIPRWGRELTPEILPPEAGLETRAIDYEKGCYVGQEVISRMKMSGQIRQRLCGVTATEQLAGGVELRAERKSAGKITSALYSPRMRAHIGLAMIKRGLTEAGTELTASSAGHDVTVRVVDLPFQDAPSAAGHSGSCNVGTAGSYNRVRTATTS
jgi:tRNA-modifying protein YgfZ